MTTNLNLHARLAIESRTLDVRSSIVAYWRGLSPASQVFASTKRLRAQSRATRKIAPREADVVLGAAAAVEVLVDGAESALAAGDVDRAEDRLREALTAITAPRIILGTKEI